MKKFLPVIFAVLSVCFLNKIAFAQSLNLGAPIPDSKPVRTSKGAMT